MESEGDLALSLPEFIGNDSQEPIDLLDSPSSPDSNTIKRDSVKLIIGGERLDDADVDTALQWEWKRDRNGSIGLL